MTASRHSPVCDGVLVTYNPDPRELSATLESLSGQVRHLHVIDNSDTRLTDAAVKQTRYQWLGGNRGIAAAQNIGLRAALADGAEWVLLSDQDTCFPKGYVPAMLAGLPDAPIGAVAPDFRDANTGARQGFVKLEGLRARRLRPREGVHEVTQAIASGMLCAAPALHGAGLMDEELFIDWVDLEWCWRARRAGWPILARADVVIDHRLGDRSAHVGRQRYPLRSANRSYYITRNALHLAGRHPALTRWQRIGIGLRAMRYLAGITALTANPTQLSAGLAGIRDACLGRLGPRAEGR